MLISTLQIGMFFGFGIGHIYASDALIVQEKFPSHILRLGNFCLRHLGEEGLKSITRNIFGLV